MKHQLKLWQRWPSSERPLPCPFCRNAPAHIPSLGVRCETKGCWLFMRLCALTVWNTRRAGERVAA